MYDALPGLEDVAVVARRRRPQAVRAIVYVSCVESLDISINVLAPRTRECMMDNDSCITKSSMDTRQPYRLRVSKVEDKMEER
jgi:hypothetical protein